MSNKQFRENRYLNESGSKTGNWYMNRLDFFQFHQYPKYKKHKFISFCLIIVFIYLSFYIIKFSILGSLPFIYLTYAALMTFNLLHSKTCRYKGYFLYPKKIINFLRDREIEVDLDDFDSIATMSKK
ncbi:MAG: hypothetical protein HRT53_16325 [Colwellia sp.]|nr:hypothetical protein [Colwellia sp.]